MAGLVLVELSLVSVVATTTGIPVGIALARVLLGTFAAAATTLYGDGGASTLHADGPAVAWIAVLGIVTPLCAAAGSVRRIARVRPLEALRPARAAHRDGRRFHRAALAGGALGACSVVAWLARSTLPVTTDVAGMIAMLGAVAGFAAMVPATVAATTICGARVIDAFGWPILPLALRDVRREVDNVAVTCAAVSMSVAGTIAVATWITSLDATVDAAFDTVFANVDLVVSGGADPFAPEAVRLPASIADELSRRRDVAGANGVRIDTIAYEDGKAMVVAADTRAYVDGRRQLYMVDGDAGTAVSGLAAGTGVVVNQAFARRFRRRLGDVLELTTPEGLLRVRIDGVYLELMPGDLGTIRLGRDLYRRWWRDDTVNLVEVSLRSGARPAIVADAIRARFGDTHRAVVLTIADLRRTYRELLGRMARLVNPLLAVAVGCAVIGVVSTGATALLARRRGTAILRAVGLTRAQLARIVACELGGVGLLAVAVAAIAGSALGWMQVEVLLRGMLGMAVLYSYPQSMVPWGSVAIVALTAVVGWMLGRRAGQDAFSGALHCE